MISIAIQVGRGIEAAHKKGIIHRDIKPQNIMISKEGKVKVTDFGIAHAVSSNTVSADLMGSVHYSSPEQARNGYVTYSSDIYSLGIVVYEMCTGRVPFDGETTVAIAIQHLQSEMQPPSVYAPNLPISLEKIIQKCTMKSPDRRYSSIDELLNDLKKALVNPDEDFVNITDVGEANQTRVISNEELSEIREKPVRPAAPPKEAPAKKQPRRPVIEDDDEDDDDGPVNPRIEKAITIMGIAAAIVILGIFVFIAGTFLDLFHFGGGGSLLPAATEETTDESNGLPVPSVLGMEEEEAKEVLADNGFVYSNGGQESSESYEEGKICSQSIDPGSSAAEGTTITVKISSGKGNIIVPDVVGQTESVAEQMIRDKGFSTPVKEYQFSDSIDQGIVISQSPEGGEDGKAEDTITIVVSQGPETVFYTFSMTVDPWKGEETDYTLEDANGEILEVWTVDSSKTLSKNRITTATGTLYYDNGEEEGSMAVTFTRQ